MEVQAAVMKLGPGRGERSPELQALGDLFLSAPAGRTPPAGRMETAARGGSERTVQPQAIVPEAAREKVPVLALLAAALAPERRAGLARAALGRLSGPQGPGLLITFRGERACVQTSGEGLAVDDADPARKLDRLIATASRIVLVLADGAGSFLAAERQLPEHCIVLATPAAESLVEAYRELKAAETWTGIVPDVFVLEAGSEAEAERAYRRLARVAIAHLGGSPTFAGRRLKRAADGGAWASPQTVMDYVSAELVYERLRSLLEKEGLRLKAEGLRNREKEETTTATTASPALWEPGVSPSPGPKGPPSPSRERGEEEAATTEEETTTAAKTATPSGKRQLMAAAANNASAPHDGESRIKTFAAWSPGTGEELLAAVREALEALLPQNRGVIELDGVVWAAERPALLAVDAAGRAVAVIAAEEEGGSANPAALLAALEAKRWVGEHLGLLARAYPEAGLDAGAETGPPVVLVAQSRSGDLELICPAGVELVAWTGVAYGEKRGVMLRRVLEATEGLRLKAEGLRNGKKEETTTETTPSPDPLPSRERGDGRVAAESSRAVEQENSRAGEIEKNSNSAEIVEVLADGLDEELSAGEEAELRRSLDLDQLT